MKRLEFWIGVLVCFFDILSAIAINVRTILEKAREYREEKK
jgi:hypothetical protein